MSSSSSIDAIHTCECIDEVSCVYVCAAFTLLVQLCEQTDIFSFLFLLE